MTYALRVPLRGVRVGLPTYRPAGHSLVTTLAYAGKPLGIDLAGHHAGHHDGGDRRVRSYAGAACPGGVTRPPVAPLDTLLDTLLARCRAPCPSVSIRRPGRRRARPDGRPSAFAQQVPLHAD
jgi:hypothetical protein